MRSLKSCIALLVGILIAIYLDFICPFMSSAAEFHVTNGAELQEALLEAGENGEDDTVYLAAGIYFNWWPDLGLRTGGFVYGTVTQQSLTLTGEFGTNAAGVILDGQDNNYVLTISDSNPYLTNSEIIVSGITFRNGNAPNDAGGLNIIAPDYNITVRDCIFINNTGCGQGGGLYLTSDKSVILENCVAMNNTVTERQFMNESGVWFDSQGGGAYLHRPMKSFFATMFLPTIKLNVIRVPPLEAGCLWGRLVNVGRMLMFAHPTSILSAIRFRKILPTRREASISIWNSRQEQIGQQTYTTISSITTRPVSMPTSTSGIILF